ncbi:hypothetical protein HDV02_001214 [Globomyces sp. JEL0801]|nr:hypothetical protein HDV02_001214 [Globomyces sp. JEL0801]
MNATLNTIFVQTALNRPKAQRLTALNSKLHPSSSATSPVTPNTAYSPFSPVTKQNAMNELNDIFSNNSTSTALPVMSPISASNFFPARNLTSRRHSLLYSQVDFSNGALAIPKFDSIPELTSSDEDDKPSKPRSARETQQRLLELRKKRESRKQTSNSAKIPAKSLWDSDDNEQKTDRWLKKDSTVKSVEVHLPPSSIQAINTQPQSVPPSAKAVTMKDTLNSNSLDVANIVRDTLNSSLLDAASTLKTDTQINVNKSVHEDQLSSPPKPLDVKSTIFGDIDVDLEDLEFNDTEDDKKRFFDNIKGSGVEDFDYKKLMAQMDDDSEMEDEELFSNNQWLDNFDKQKLKIVENQPLEDHTDDCSESSVKFSDKIGKSDIENHDETSRNNGISDIISQKQSNVPNIEGYSDSFDSLSELPIVSTEHMLADSDDIDIEAKLISTDTVKGEDNEVELIKRVDTNAEDNNLSVNISPETNSKDLKSVVDIPENPTQSQEVEVDMEVPMDIPDSDIKENRDSIEKLSAPIEPALAPSFDTSDRMKDGNNRDGHELTLSDPDDKLQANIVQTDYVPITNDSYFPKPVDPEILPDNPVFISRPKNPEETIMSFADLMRLNEEPIPESSPISSPKKTTVAKKKSLIKKQPPNEVKVNVQAVKKNILKSVNEKGPRRLEKSAPSKVKASTSKIPKKSIVSIPSTTPIPPETVEMISMPLVTPVTIEDSNELKESKSLVESQQLLINELLEKNKKLETQGHAMESHITILEKKIEKKDETLDSQLQQIRFLEKLVEEEKSNSTKPIGPSLSVVESERIKKEIVDQEFLIRGYQTENEKLLQQTKELKLSITELEQRHFLKQENLGREISNLKMQLETTVDSENTRPNFTSTKEKLKIESLEAELRDLKHTLETTQEDSKLEKEKYLAQLADMGVQLQKISDSEPEQIKKMALEFETQKGHFQDYIFELETKLEWHIGNEEVFNDAQRQLARSEKLMADLNALLDNKFNGIYKRSPTDIRRIKLLESQMEELQEKLVKETRGVSDLGTSANRPDINGTEYIRYLKKKVQTLEQENLQVKNIEQSKFTHLVEQYKEEKLQLEVQMSNLKSEQEKVQNQLKNDLEIAAHECGLLANQVEQYKEQINALSQLNSENHPDLVLKESVASLTAKFKSQETRLKKRIIEAESLIDKQSIRNSQLLIDKDNAAKEFTKRLQEKDILLTKLENRYMSLQKEFHEKILLQDTTLHSEMAILKKELDIAVNQNEALKMKIEMNESARKVVHETTLELLKQSQMESTKFAFSHQERSIEVIRDELRKEQQIQQRSILEPYKARIAELENQISQHPSYTALQKQLEDTLVKLQKLTVSYNELEIVHMRCEERFNLNRENLAPSLAEFDRLSSRIQDMEANARKREHQLRQSLESKASAMELSFEKERVKYQQDLLKKDNQIQGFQKELEYVIEGITQLKVQKR